MRKEIKKQSKYLNMKKIRFKGRKRKLYSLYSKSKSNRNERKREKKRNVNKGKVSYKEIYNFNIPYKVIDKKIPREGGYIGLLKMNKEIKQQTIKLNGYTLRNELKKLRYYDIVSISFIDRINK